MRQNSLSIVIIAGQEEDTIVDCLKSAAFADDIILLATHTCTPKTIKLAKATCPKINIKYFKKSIVDFSAWHNFAAKLVTSDWQFHLDCDERISPDLKTEIISTINQSKNKITNYDIPRANYFLGQRVRYGGTYPDYVKRLYKSHSLISYQGTLHEQPNLKGPSAVLKSDLFHYTHRNLSTMLAKSLIWTDSEAKMLLADHHPPIVWWRIIRMMLTKMWQRLIVQQMWRDGTVGWISLIFETFDTFMIYARLWELQQHE